MEDLHLDKFLESEVAEDITILIFAETAQRVQDGPMVKPNWVVILFPQYYTIRCIYSGGTMLQ